MALKKRYYDLGSPSAFARPELLKQYTGKSSEKINDFLISQDAYTRHHYQRKRFPRNPVVVRAIDHIWQADLVDMSRLSKFNDQYRYLVTVIDVFSKRAYAVAIKNKSAPSLIEAFRLIFSETDRRPFMLQTDRGSEFFNKKFRAYLQKNNIHFYTTYNSQTKASVVERFNRTLKSLVFKYFTAKNTNRYIDVLPKLIQTYNTRYHRTIKRAPLDVNYHNQNDIYESVYKPMYKKRKIIQKFTTGDFVRVSMSRNVFAKGYEPTYSGEIFVIDDVRTHLPFPVYTLKDLNNEEINGTFYEYELLRVKKPEVFEIEKVLARKTVRKKRYLFVKWMHYPNSANSWIPETAIIPIKN